MPTARADRANRGARGCFESRPGPGRSRPLCVDCHTGRMSGRRSRGCATKVEPMKVSEGAVHLGPRGLLADRIMSRHTWSLPLVLISVIPMGQEQARMSIGTGRPYHSPTNYVSPQGCGPSGRKVFHSAAATAPVERPPSPDSPTQHTARDRHCGTTRQQAQSGAL